MKEKELSIIVTSYRKPELLELCLNSIFANLKNDLDYEVIVADSETREETRDLMREKFPEITFISNEKNVGFGVLANQGMRKARGSYYFIINHDIIIKDDAIQSLLSYLRNERNVGLVGPKLVNFDGSIQPSAFRFYKLRTIVFRRTFLQKFAFAKRHLDWFLMKDEIAKKKILEVDWVMGSAMMVSREAVEKVGGFDEHFFLYFEDVDWCWRFWQAGYKVIYNQNVTVAHYHGKASGNKSVLEAVLLNKFARIHIKSALYFFWKHWGEERPH